MNVFIMQDSLIKPFGRDAQNALIGFVGENNSRTFFIRTRDDLTGYTVSLVIDETDCGAMTKTPMPDGSTMLTLTLTSGMLGQGGNKICQLIMANDTTVKKSSQFFAFVGLANDITQAATDSATLIVISEAITQMISDSIPPDYSDLLSDIDDIKADLGDLSELETTAKSDLVAAINEAAQSGGSGGGLTADVKEALLACFCHVVWDDDDPTGQSYIDALEDALYPPADLVSISAVYTQSGTVYDTDSLDSLKTDLVVTATYSDSDTETVSSSDYTLSGTLTGGTSTITVSYGGKTTTFSVTVTANPYLAYWDFTKSLVDTVNGYEFTLSKGTNLGTLERTSAGLVFSSPDTGAYGAVAKLDDSITFPKGSKLTIEFGASDAQFTHNSGVASGTTYGLGNGGLLGGVITVTWRGSKDKFYSYGSDWTDKWISTTPDYFNNKTMVIEVASDKTRTVTVDGVAFGTVPGSEISSDVYTFLFGRKSNTDQTFHDIVIKKVYVETLSS